MNSATKAAKHRFDRAASLQALQQSPVPRHVGVIMDGNGRWAAARGKNRSEGHKAGVERLRSVLQYSADAGVECLTVYAFSKENWKRPRWEVETLMRLLLEYLEKELPRLHSQGVQIGFIGDRQGLSARVLAAMDKARDATKHNHRLRFHIALNYGGRDEILRAVQRCVQDAAAHTAPLAALDEDGFEALLDTAGLPAVDLVIRTSGEKRLSNFLLWQCAYAEFVFVEEHWPDFDDEQYAQALGEFQRRERRFGGLGT